MKGFAKRNHLGLRLGFELGICSESTLDELSVAFYGASLAATIFKIRCQKCSKRQKVHYVAGHFPVQ